MSPRRNRVSSLGGWSRSSPAQRSPSRPDPSRLRAKPRARAPSQATPRLSWSHPSFKATLTIRPGACGPKLRLGLSMDAAGLDAEAGARLSISRKPAAWRRVPEGTAARRERPRAAEDIVEFPYPLLVCDIGGTNVRIAAVEARGA